MNPRMDETIDYRPLSALMQLLPRRWDAKERELWLRAFEASLDLVVETAEHGSARDICDYLNDWLPWPDGDVEPASVRQFIDGLEAWARASTLKANPPMP